MEAKLSTVLYSQVRKIPLPNHNFRHMFVVTRVKKRLAVETLCVNDVHVLSKLRVVEAAWHTFLMGVRKDKQKFMVYRGLEVNGSC